jgi:sulfur carrier protein
VIVHVNGRPEELPEGSTVADVVERVGTGGQRRGVAVAVDGEVVRSADWEEKQLSERQTVEVVRAVQGG